MSSNPVVREKSIQASSPGPALVVGRLFAHYGKKQKRTRRRKRRKSTGSPRNHSSLLRHHQKRSRPRRVLESLSLPPPNLRLQKILLPGLPNSGVLENQSRIVPLLDFLQKAETKTEGRRRCQQQDDIKGEFCRVRFQIRHFSGVADRIHWLVLWPIQWRLTTRHRCRETRNSSVSMK